MTSTETATADGPLAAPNLVFLGKAGAGKTTCAEKAVKIPSLSYQRFSFADPLKQIASELWGHEARSDREKLQRLGIAVREIDTDVWCRLGVERALRENARGLSVVNDDCRFPNEYWALKGVGFKFVRVTAPIEVRIERLQVIGKLQNLEQLSHESETAIDDLPADHIIENDGNTDLWDAVLRIINIERSRS